MRSPPPSRRPRPCQPSYHVVPKQNGDAAPAAGARTGREAVGVGRLRQLAPVLVHVVPLLFHSDDVAVRVGRTDRLLAGGSRLSRPLDADGVEVLSTEWELGDDFNGENGGLRRGRGFGLSELRGEAAELRRELILLAVQTGDFFGREVEELLAEGGHELADDLLLRICGHIGAVAKSHSVFCQ